MDESGISTVPCKLPKVLSSIGSRRVSKLVSGERGKNITVVCGVSSAGVYVPPFILFPRIRMKDELARGTPPGTVCVCNETGWMTTDTFILYLTHFSKYVRPNIEYPILLSLDNHASHVSLKAIEFCRLNYIIMLGFPPHTTNWLQNLDVAIFGALKTYYSQACDAWMVSNPGKVIRDADVGQLF